MKVGGYADPAGTGKLIATRLERDEPEDEVELRGPASDIAATSLKVFGVSVELLPGTEYEDDDRSHQRREFLARAAGQVVEVDGSWNGASLLADKAEIEHEGTAALRLRSRRRCHRRRPVAATRRQSHGPEPHRP